MNKKKPRAVRTWVEVDTKAFEHNYKTFRRLLKPETKLLAVVKSNAYGHDFRQYSKEAQRLGVDWLGVDSITEAIPLRQEGITLPILVLGYTLPLRLAEAAVNDVSISVSNFNHLKAIKALGAASAKLRIHLKFDTGFCRQGFLPEEAEKVLKYLTKELPRVKTEGVFTHFAEAKNPSLLVKTKAQWMEFQKVLAAVGKFGLKPICHAAATGATLTFPKSHLDMVRLGIGMYGLWPETATKSRFEKEITLRPILSWKTLVSEVKIIKSGGTVGYDSTERVAPGTKLAILPVGYWHGYTRALSGVGNVLINNRRAKVVGRVSMDMVAVDVTSVKRVKIGDEAILLGGDITAEELADLSGTSNYEVVTRINPLIRRIYF